MFKHFSMLNVFHKTSNICKVIIIIIIIIILVITFMQDIYNFTPEINHVYSSHNVAAVLYLQSVLRIVLFRPCNMFCTTSVHSAVRVQCPVRLFL